MSLIFIGLILLYFITGTHRKVLNHFGLTDRDDTLIFIGFFIPGFLGGLFGLVSGLIAGTAILAHVIHLLICGFFIFFNYRQL